MKEALFYEKLGDGNVRCALCPHNCVIAEGKSGFCGVRKNTDGILETLVYGKVSSVAIDPIEKKPLFNFNPGSSVFSMGTLGCNMHCQHCQNWEISHAVLAQSLIGDKAFEIDAPKMTEFVSPETAVSLALARDCDGIAWTYNEPTVWFEYTLDSAKIAKEAGLYTAYVTNGYINEEPLKMIAPYLDAFRVDIKSFRDDFYKNVAQVPSKDPVLKSAKYAKIDCGIHVEAVTNIIPGMNDSDGELKEIASWINNELGSETPWHVTRFYPHHNYASLPATPIETLERAHEIGESAGLKYVYVGNVFGHQGENTYCPKCANIVIERQGYDIVRFDMNDDNLCNFCEEKISIKWNRPL